MNRRLYIVETDMEPGPQQEEIFSAQESGDRLLSERRIMIRHAYGMLPEPNGFPEGYRYKVPYITGNCTDFYVFVLKSGRWAMEVGEFNRHLFRGIYV